MLDAVETWPEPKVRQSIDIEGLLHWAISQTGRLPWRGVSDRELAFDFGYNVIPKGCRREYQGGGTLLTRAIDPDAATVIAALERLDPAIVAVVIACARQNIRPDWMEGIEPKRVTKSVYGHVRRGKHKRKRRGRPTLTTVWEPCEPAAICAARDVYIRWHAALVSVAAALQTRLSGWRINGFTAPSTPWQSASEKTP